MRAYKANMIPGGVTPTINVSQYDNDYAVTVTLIEGAEIYTPPAGATIRVEGTKPDGHGFEYPCTYQGNVVTMPIYTQMTVVSGRFPIELVVYQNGLRVGSCNIVFAVEKAPLGEDTDISETVIPDIIAGAQAQADAAAASATQAASSAASAETAKTAAMDAAQDAIDAAQELQTAIQFNAALIHDTASGAVASFSDGADNIPMQSVVAEITPVQSGSGDPSPSNIRPISGRTGLTVTAAGKNLFNDVFSQQTPNQIQSAALTLPAGTYTYSQKYNGTPTWGVYVLRPDNTDIARVYNTNKVTFTLSQEESVVIRVYYGDGITPANITEAQIEAGSTATQYAPYVAPTTYPVTWETEAGTVYGGTLDVVSGVLTVDRVMETITKDGIWYGFVTGSGNASATIQLRDYQNVKYVDGASSRNGAIASTGVEAQNYWVGARQNEIPPDGDMCFAYSSSGQLRFHRSDVANITDLETFKAAFPDTQIVYPLTTPQTYQLTPTEVRTILGGNTIYTDAGDVSVEYVADTKLYIDNKIAELQALVLEN